MQRSSKYSRRINYAAVESLFSNPSTSATQDNAVPTQNLLDGPEINIDEKEEYMYTIDEKSDGEGVGGQVVVEESGGGVGINSSKNGANEQNGTRKTRDAEESGRDTADEDEGEGNLYVDGTGEEGYGWEEEYQQEV